MFVQILTMQVPSGQIGQLRELIATEYLPALQGREGFRAAHLLEQVDDRDHTKLLIFWDSQAAVEKSGRTGVLAGSTTSIVARMPGLNVARDSYIVKVSATESVASA
jgi:quinol monooxygenase YgiN